MKAKRKIHRLIILVILFASFFILASMSIRDWISSRNYPDVFDVYDRIDDLEQLLPKTRELALKLLEEAEKQGLLVKIIETYRSQERQEELYAKGRNKPGNVVTWTKNSMHTQRKAFDICQNIPGREYSDESFFRKCAHIAQEIGLEAGYFWDIPDKGHFQLP